jgi:hypothetical protein
MLEAVSLVRDLPRLEPPQDMWLGVKAKLGSAAKPSWRERFQDLIAPWVRRPIYVALILLALLTASGVMGWQMFIRSRSDISEMPLLSLCIREHAQYYAQQILPPDPLLGSEVVQEMGTSKGEGITSNYELQTYISLHYEGE